MNKKAILLTAVLSLCTLSVTLGQIHVKPYRAPQTRKGNFGKYPTKVRLAPIISFGSASANFTKNDSIAYIQDSAFVEKIGNDPNYYSFGSNIKSGSQFGIGLMLDIPFSRHITFRPRFMYQSKTIGDATDYVQEDTVQNTYISYNCDNQKKFTQFETMFMLNVNFGSDRKKTRFFIGGGFGLGLNSNVTNDYSFQNVIRALDNPDLVYVDIDTSGSSSLGLGGNVYEDFFDKTEFLMQFEGGANIGPSFVVMAQYNTSLGNIFTDPRAGSYTPYYYSLGLSYIIGAKPDLWGY